jgi:hypothetical protein
VCHTGPQALFIILSPLTTLMAATAPCAHGVLSRTGSSSTEYPVGWLWAFDGQDADQHAQPFGVLERLALLPVSFDRRETGGLEKREGIVTGQTDSCGGTLAGGAGCSPDALLAAQDSHVWPQPASSQNSATLK